MKNEKSLCSIYYLNDFPIRCQRMKPKEPRWKNVLYRRVVYRRVSRIAAHIVVTTIPTGLCTAASDKCPEMPSATQQYVVEILCVL